MTTLTKNPVRSECLTADSCDTVETLIDGIAHLRAVIRVENYLHVLTACGPLAADALLDEVRSFFDASLGERTCVRSKGGSGKFVVSLAHAVGEDTQSLGKYFAMQLQKLCMAAMSRSFSCADELLHPILSFSRLALNGASFSAGDEILRFDDVAPRSNGTCAIGYRNDMAAAAGFLAELAEDRLCLRWQPIASASDGGGFLFQEASVCSLDLLHDRVSQQGEIEAAERVGLGRVIDRWSAEQVLERLHASPFAQLGVRILASSAVVDGWWSEIFDHLRRHPDEAQRLTVIISGATPFSAFSDAQVFIRRLRTLGCRIALDNFGVGFASLRHLLVLSPDVVKIDSLFTHWAEQSAHSASILGHGIQLAGATGAAVVVNGISTDRQRAIAIQAGAQWLQGDLVAEARFGLSGAFQEGVQSPAPLHRRAFHQPVHGSMSL